MAKIQGYSNRKFGTPPGYSGANTIPLGIGDVYLEQDAARDFWYQIDKASDSIHTKSRLASSVICGLGALRPLWQTRFRICIPDSFMDRFFRPRSLFGSERSAFLADL